MAKYQYCYLFVLVLTACSNSTAPSTLPDAETLERFDTKEIDLRLSFPNGEWSGTRQDADPNAIKSANSVGATLEDNFLSQCTCDDSLCGVSRERFEYSSNEIRWLDAGNNELGRCICERLSCTCEGHVQPELYGKITLQFHEQGLTISRRFESPDRISSYVDRLTPKNQIKRIGQ